MTHDATADDIMLTLEFLLKTALDGMDADGLLNFRRLYGELADAALTQSRHVTLSHGRQPPDTFVSPDRVQMAVEAVARAHWRRNPHTTNSCGVIPLLARGTMNPMTDFGPVTFTVYDPPPEVRDPHSYVEIARERLNQWAKDPENPAKEPPLRGGDGAD